MRFERGELMGQDPTALMDARRRRLEFWLSVVLIVTALDTVYLSWRFTALYAGWVTPGTGLCSWTAGIDCDKVLTTPEARAFVVPNAILGLGFYTGALWWWWFLGRRLGPAYRPHLVRSLAFWLGVASLMTLAVLVAAGASGGAVPVLPVEPRADVRGAVPGGARVAADAALADARTAAAAVVAGGAVRGVVLGVAGGVVSGRGDRATANGVSVIGRSNDPDTA
jgi:uncharacterized membrane protein